MHEFTVYGTPKAQKRHRHTRVGRHIHVYDPSADDKELFLSKLSPQISRNSIYPIFGEIKISLTFYMPIPKSYPKWKRQVALSNELKHTKKPDIDNLCKFVLDAIRKAVFKDDSQVWHLESEKRYSEQPRTVIQIMEAE